MPPKQKHHLKAALHSVEKRLHRLFRSHDHTPSAAEPKTESTVYLTNTDWEGLERFIGIQQANSSAFGPLTSTIGRLSGYVKMFEEQARTREEYKKLGADLNDLLHVLAAHFEIYPTSITLDSFSNLARSIDEEIKQLAIVKDMGPQDDGGATQDVDQILRCYRQLRILLALFVMNENAKMWKVDDDEALDVDRTGCMPNTRREILQDLREWVHYGKFQKVYWLNGIAGTGKTTIAYSLCEWLENSGKPAASFFCSRDLPNCRNVKRILPSVSYQLARLSRPFRCAVSSALEQDSELCNRPVDEQFHGLIAGPLKNVGHTFGVDVVIVLDALDECGDTDGVNQILDACFNDSSSLPVRFLITSRQSPGILDRMRASQGGARRSQLKLHEVDRTIALEDVRTYLGAIRTRFNLSHDTMECLAKQSGASFVYVASIVRYLNQGDVSERAERQKRLLDTASSAENPNDRQIDTMYTAILEETLDSSGLAESRKAEIMLVLRTAACARDPLALNAIAELLSLDFSCLVNNMLHLVLLTWQVSDVSGQGITLCESFSSYLVDRQRSGRFYCDGQRDNRLVAQLCFNRISAVSQPFNVCNLDSSYLLDREVVDIDERVNEAIPQGLWYASRHWGTHLKQAKPSDELLTCLHGFLSRRLLLWMEIMNLKRSMPEAIELLHGVHLWLQEVECPDIIRDLVLDSWKFVAAFSSSAASENTPHIYVSALRFWPAHQAVSIHYMAMLRNVVKAKGARGKNRVEDVVVLDGPDMKVLRPPQHVEIGGAAGGSYNPGAVATGQNVDRPGDGHTNRVGSVAYSPDGVNNASGSDDETVRIWDAQTGQPVGQPLNGHASDVNSAAYSPDGAYIASGCDDKTVRIWDAQTGQPVGQPLNGHMGGVNSVAYSPDGAYIASGSDDKTVRIWDAQAGQPVGQPLNGHTSGVWSVAYSPDCAYIASGSDDKTVRIWDAHTGQPVGQPLNGHTASVWSVAYSPDGAYIASGSADKTARIWDAQTGQPVGQPLNGHTSGVLSVAYSSDGAYIASGSADDTVGIWDAHTGQYLSQPIRSGAQPRNRSIIPSALARYITRISRKPDPATAISRMLTTEELLRRWTFDDEGWVVNARQERLIWVPEDLQEFVLVPPALNRIPLGDHVILDFRDATLGTQWRDCFDSSRLCS
ncbi:hypothetical protein FRC10_005450 [Ceratobasidium sp. 414]|nr:hypothetical protein FRC10_005450 [Ceratobasidium sp. 414]